MSIQKIAFKITFLSILLFAVIDGTPNSLYSNEGGAGEIQWIRVKENIAPRDFFEAYADRLAFEESNEMILVEVNTDALGYSHYKFQQHYKNIPIEGGIFILHSVNDSVKKANGLIVNGLELNTSPTISKAQSLQYALESLSSSKYAWQDVQMEQMLKYALNDASASFYPNPKLVIANPAYSAEGSNYLLCWKMEVYSVSPLFNKEVYVNAQTGEIEYTLDLLHDANGVAITKYSGQQNIVTDSVAPDTFLLRDYSRGKGVETFDMNTLTDYDSAVDFRDNDNYWDNFNVEEDEAATDAHWGTEMTYDYFLQKHNRYSFDGDTSKLISYVHYDQNYINAFWNGKWATYGDGSGSYSPLTAIDIVGHEIAHGVTGNSAKLIYKDESGALNESFSDIFGSMVEKFAIPDSFDWYVGEDCHTGNGFRSMSNPKQMGDPDTYFGTNWYTGSFDNGGVHTNSGVQNFWFYLLSEGGSGTNDNGDNYSVTALGTDVAGAIAYRNLAYYLTPSSQHIDARHGAIFAAEDLYGKCSNEVIQVGNAWHAVGVGKPISDYDIWVFDVLSPNTGCGLSANEQLEIKMRYNGCGVTLSPGDSIPLAYSLNNGPAVRDTLVLSNSLSGGDTIGFVFSQTLDLSTVGVHDIDVWSEMPGDTIQYNDTIKNYLVEHILQQNTDVGITRLVSPVSHCSLSSQEEISLEVGFYGCDSLVAGTQFDVTYQFNNGSPITETVTLSNHIYPGDTIFYTFNSTIDASPLGQFPFEIWTDFTGDVDNSNDSVTGILIQNPINLKEEVVQFEDSINVVDTLMIFQTENTIARVSSKFPNTGIYGFQITGAGDVRDLHPNFKVPDSSKTWNHYEHFGSKLCFCVDGTNWGAAELVFDLRQTYAATHQLVMGSGNRSVFGSSMRVLGDGTQMSGLYHPNHFFNDTFETHYVNFDAFAGTEFEVCFETRTYFNEEDEDVPYGKGDNVFLDNIYFNFVVGIEELELFSDLTLYPVPAHSILNVNWFAKGNELVEFTVMDVVGKQIMKHSASASAGQNTVSLNIGSLDAGTYFLHTSSSSGQFSKAFVVAE